MAATKAGPRAGNLDGGARKPGSIADLARPRLADEVAQLLRNMILSGELEPGTPLLQIQLSERLGVSRTPLREAFRTLERDGLVRISNGNKTIEVVQMDIDRLLETYEVREVIDGLAARLVAKRGMSEETAAALESYLEEMESASDQPADLARYGEAHSSFHGGIVEASGNSQLENFLPIVRLTSHMQTYRFVQQAAHDRPSLVGPEDVTRMLCVGNEDHRAIFDAMRDGRSRDAETAAKRHIRKAAHLAEDVRDRLAEEERASA